MVNNVNVSNYHVYQNNLDNNNNNTNDNKNSVSSNKSVFSSYQLEKEQLLLDELKNKFHEIQMLPEQEQDSEYELLDELIEHGVKYFKGELFKLVMQGCAAPREEKILYIRLFDAYQAIWGRTEIESEATNFNLDEIEKQFFKIENLSEKEIESRDKEALLEFLTYLSALHIMGKRYDFLEKAAKVDQIRKQFFQRVLIEHYHQLIIESSKYHVPLWKIENANTHNKGYLCGTMHLTPMIAIGNTIIHKIMHKCSFLTLELDITKPENFKPRDEPKVDEAIIKHLKQVENERKKLNIPLVRRNPTGSPRLTTFEEQLIGLAKDTGLQLESLETLETQQKVISTIQKENIGRIVDIVANVSITPSGFVKSEEDSLCSIDLWRKNSLNEIHYLNHITLSKEVVEQVFDKRNLDMADTIDKLMQHDLDTRFFAVGVGHFTGENGLISLLEKKGYKMTPINVCLNKPAST